MLSFFSDGNHRSHRETRVVDGSCGAPQRLHNRLRRVGGLFQKLTIPWLQQGVSSTATDAQPSTHFIVMPQIRLFSSLSPPEISV